MVDEDGYYRVPGRIKDMIIRGGENIYPLEVENFLLTMPGVLDAQVVGIPDARLGEIVGPALLRAPLVGFLDSTTLLAGLHQLLGHFAQLEHLHLHGRSHGEIVHEEHALGHLVVAGPSALSGRLFRTAGRR